MAYSNYSVAHAWAHNLDKMHDSSSTSHSEGCFLSYSTCIAQRIEVNGKTAYLLNDAQYSRSTLKHQSIARSAVPVGKIMFRCKFLNWGNRKIINDYNDNLKHNRISFGLRYIMDELIVCQNMKTARKLNTSVSYHGFDELKRWLDFTGDTTIPKLLRMPIREFEALMPVFSDYTYQGYKSYNLPASLVRKFLKLCYEHRGLDEICDAINGSGTYDAWNKRQQSIRKAQETYRNNAPQRLANAELRRKKEQEQWSYAQRVIQERGDEGRRDLWHEGYNVNIPFTNTSLFYGGNVLLRVKGRMVETSKGIKITKTECERLWTIISRWHANDTEFIAGERVKATMSSFFVSRYQNDIMIAGCHAVAYKEMERVAHQLGFTSTSVKQ
jgi:hypothetical protein